MKRSYIPCTGAALLMCALSSCNLVRKNVDAVSDRMSPAMADNVMVESGGVLPEIAPFEATAAAPATPQAPQPNVAAQPPVKLAGRIVTVAPGDTLSGIARKNDSSVAAICSANGITPATPIRPGQKLKIPRGAAQSVAAAPRAAARPAAASAKTYKVRRGETLSGIAARHHVSVSALMRANNLTPHQADRIREGQTLRIPR